MPEAIEYELRIGGEERIVLVSTNLRWYHDLLQEHTLRQNIGNINGITDCRISRKEYLEFLIVKAPWAAEWDEIIPTAILIMHSVCTPHDPPPCEVIALCC